MSKLLAALTATTGGTAIAVGGSYLLKQGNGEGAGQNSKVDSVTTGLNLPSSPETSGGPTAGQTGVSAPSGTTPSDTTQTQPPAKEEGKKLKFSTLNDFKTNKGYKCSENVFPDSFSFGDLSNVNSFSKESPVGTDYFGTPSTEEGKIKSCLIINWEKKTYTKESNKGSGIFTGTGSFVNDTKGFIVTNIAKAEKETGKLKLTGGAYLLEKTNENWEVKYKKEQTDEKEFSEASFEEKFPKAKADSGVSVDAGNYWGFMSDKGDLQNICTSCSDTGDGKEVNKKVEEFKWIYKSDEDKKISEWSDNLNGWDEMFDKSSFDLENNLKSFKGTGSKVTDASVPQESQ